MKKMNFSFLRLDTKLALTLFLFLGLFFIATPSVNAQYVSSADAKTIIDGFMKNLPPLTASIRAKGHAMTPKMVNESKNELNYRFGERILYNLSQGASVGDAIDKSYSFAQGRLPAEWLNEVKQQYIQLLKA